MIVKTDYRERFPEIREFFEKVSGNLPYRDKDFLIETKERLYTTILRRMAADPNRTMQYFDVNGSVGVYDNNRQDRYTSGLIEDAYTDLTVIIPEVETDLTDKAVKVIKKGLQKPILNSISHLIFQGYPNTDINGVRVVNGNGTPKAKVEEPVMGETKATRKRAPKAKVEKPVEEGEKPKRKRRTKAEMEAARAAGTAPPKRERKKKE